MTQLPDPLEPTVDVLAALTPQPRPRPRSSRMGLQPLRHNRGSRMTTVNNNPSVTRTVSFDVNTPVVIPQPVITVRVVPSYTDVYISDVRVLVDVYYSVNWLSIATPFKEDYLRFNFVGFSNIYRMVDTTFLNANSMVFKRSAVTDGSIVFHLGDLLNGGNFVLGGIGRAAVLVAGGVTDMESFHKEFTYCIYTVIPVYPSSGDHVPVCFYFKSLKYDHKIDNTYMKTLDAFHIETYCYNIHNGRTPQWTTQCIDLNVRSCTKSYDFRKVLNRIPVQYVLMAPVVVEEPEEKDTDEKEQETDEMAQLEVVD